MRFTQFQDFDPIRHVKLVKMQHLIELIKLHYAT